MFSTNNMYGERENAEIPFPGNKNKIQQQDAGNTSMYKSNSMGLLPDT